MRHQIILAGKAGQGPNLLSELIAKGILNQGYYVFYSRDYQSLIRGGHNFNTLSFSDNLIASNQEKSNILVPIDKASKAIHQKDLTKQAIVLDSGKSNMFYAGSLYKILNLDISFLEQELKQYENLEQNLEQVKLGYNQEKRTIQLPEQQNNIKKWFFMNGNSAIAQSAISSGLNIYYAYPMTPATGVLTDLAQLQKQKENKHLVVQLENEISVINAALGSSIAGSKSMVGTSGGGFDLMTEAISLAGIAEIPIVIYLSQRPGPGTGVPTYTGQGDLNIARHAGHGEFPRIVLAPGRPREAIELTNQAFYFSQKFKIPTVIIGDKHLAESKFCFPTMPTLTKIPKAEKLKRHSSYETDKQGSATEDRNIIQENIKQRLNKQQEIEIQAKKFQQYKLYTNNHPNTKNLIIAWGSTKGAILDAVQENNLNTQFMQILYIEPFPDIRQQLEDKNLILVENNSTGQLAQLIKEKTGITIPTNNKILKGNSREFNCDELKREIKKRLK